MSSDGDEAHRHVAAGGEAQIEAVEIGRLLHAARHERHAPGDGEALVGGLQRFVGLEVALRAHVVAIAANGGGGVLRERGDGETLRAGEHQGAFRRVKSAGALPSGAGAANACRLVGSGAAGAENMPGRE